MSGGENLEKKDFKETERETAQPTDRAQEEVTEAQHSGTTETGKQQFEKAKEAGSNLENTGSLPRVDLKPEEAESAQALAAKSGDKKANPGDSQAATADGKPADAPVDSQPGDQQTPTGITLEPRPDVNKCSDIDPKVVNGRAVVSLNVEQPGLHPMEPYAKTTLSGIPVNNGDGRNERSFVTTAHGMVKLASDPNKDSFQLLDDGFKISDTNGDGSLDKDELKKRASEVKADPNNEKLDRLSYQANYVLSNYDSIAETSKKLDPNAKGVTNEGLAQHYLEKAKVTIKTHDGTTIPAQVIAGDRNTDIAVLKASGVTQQQHESIGKNYKISRRDAEIGQTIDSIGHAGGTQGADARCFVPTQARGMVVPDKLAPLMPGKTSTIGVGIIGGMSGGPAMDANRDVVVGLNHASAPNRATITSARAIQKELLKAREISRRL